MKVFVVLSMLVAAAVAQLSSNEQYVPIPYSFNYVANTEDGGNSGHQEQGDGAGRVTGSYTVTNLEGHTRVVDYIADEEGFRATVRSNEPGTTNQNPAGVTVESTAVEANPIMNSAAISSAPVSRPAARPVAPAAPATAPATTTRGGVRYVLVPITE